MVGQVVERGKIRSMHCYCERFLEGPSGRKGVKRRFGVNDAGLLVVVVVAHSITRGTNMWEDDFIAGCTVKVLCYTSGW